MAEEADEPKCPSHTLFVDGNHSDGGAVCAQGDWVGLGCVAYTLEQKSKCSHVKQACIYR